MNAITYADQDATIRYTLVELVSPDAPAVPERLLAARGLVIGLVAAGMFWTFVAAIVVSLV